MNNTVPIEFQFLLAGLVLSTVAMFCAGKPRKRPGVAKARFGLACATLGAMFCLPVMKALYDGYQTGDQQKQFAAIWLGTRVGLIVVLTSVIATWILWKFAFPPKQE